ncbi:UV DNA damage repair endonuclease UvsE [Eubacteriaceae bacterium ES2]|nr:UV DNA damage repair endonuclease UvsE [Eubacteriaceae bacterium ES2]
MRIGYACQAIAVPGSKMNSCQLKNASPERLLALAENNLQALDTLISYNIKNSIRLFRISSDLIPFGSSVAANICWEKIFSDQLVSIGQRILNSGMRVSMHPGQYTVLNSPDETVVTRAVEDLYYHAKVLDSMNLGNEHKIILHLGGVYGNKKQAIKRFISHYNALSSAVKRRLVIENDDRMYTIKDALEVSSAIGIPVVFDNLHNTINPSDQNISDNDLIKLCSQTWGEDDGPQKIHYSQQHPEKNPGAHSQSIRISPFLAFYRTLSDQNIDIMLEVKDKNLSALKCVNCTSKIGIFVLENEWAHYKYCILERSPVYYQKIRLLLNNKNSYPALEMYQMIEASFDLPITSGNGINAAQHVWGYFKKIASEAEAIRFSVLQKNFYKDEIKIAVIKRFLFRLAVKYQINYLLDGYYFYL